MRKSFLAAIFIILVVFVFSLHEIKTRYAVVEDAGQVGSEPISISPSTIYPGDPIMITAGVGNLVPRKITFDGKKVPLILYDTKIRGFIPIDFYEKNSSHIVEVTFSNGTQMSKAIAITHRQKIEKPLGIPEKLGGNTTAAAQSIVSNLERENAILNNIKTAPTSLWSDAFSFPLPTIFVTDDYGYNRTTVGETIVHKGTDFRASVGTPVAAMNNGVVRISRMFTVYGNTIVVDHGKGIQTLYMHLSKRNVKEGDMVKRGEIIGLSGMTGYAEGAHLHVSIKINGISIDPMTFMHFFVSL